jgi:hypothetical protein
VGLANLIVGLFFLLFYGPPTFLNRHLLHRAKRITPDQPEPPLRWIQVNAIVAAWTGALVAFVLLALHALGGNGAVLGWLAVLTGIYVLVVMGFNPRLIGGIVLVLIVLVLGLVVALILEKEGQNYPIVEWFLWLIFRTGMDFYPFPTAMLGGAAAILVIADALFQLTWYRNFVDANHFNMYSTSGPRKTLPRDDYTPQDDISDIVEFFTVRVASITFEPKDASKQEVVQERVPYARQVADELKKRASITNVSMRPE